MELEELDKNKRSKERGKNVTHHICMKSKEIDGKWYSSQVANIKKEKENNLQVSQVGSQVLYVLVV